MTSTKPTYVLSWITDAFTEEIRDIDGNRYSFFLELAESAVVPSFDYEGRRWPYPAGVPH